MSCIWQYTELVNCSFHDNDGTALVVESANITLAGNSEFKHNHGLCGDSLQGGAIYAVGSNLTFTGNATFLDNSAGIVGGFLCTDRGGGIYIQNTVISFSGTTNFINNSAGGEGGGAVYTSDVLSFGGTSNFINNSVLIDSLGGAIYTSSVLSFSGTTNFINNSAGVGGAVCTFGSNVLSFNETTNFINNSAHSGGGAVYVDNYSNLSFNGTVNFTNNICSVDENVDAAGGGVYMGLQSTFSILPNTTVYWENNHANFGGAIFVHDASPVSYCILGVPQYQKKNVSSNYLVRICPMALMSN